MDVRLIKAVLGSELRIAPGRMIAARVVNADGRGRGVITIAGEPLEASLPEHLQPGQELRLVVREVSSERVVLGLADQLTATQRGAAAGRRLVPRQATRTPRAPGVPAHGPALRRSTLRYDAPALGAVDLRFELSAGSLRVAVALAPGQPLASAQERAGELQDALQGAVAQAVSVSVEPRHDPLDLYA